jgi:hypothetical protein
MLISLVDAYNGAATLFRWIRLIEFNDATNKWSTIY